MKRLITCTDGTWNKPGDTEDGKSIDTNVCLIYNAIAERDGSGIRQLKVYDTGVGSGYTINDQIMGGMAGEGLDKRIKDVYSFLVLNYAKGDELYLFGFSRGAYTARSLAGFIRNCGILKPENLTLLDKAYQLYRDRNTYTMPDSDMMVSFRRNYCFKNITPIKFIGVWDTVGAMGIPLPWFNTFNYEKYKFHDVTLSSTIEYAYQALAIDEHREMFEPSIWKRSTNNVCNKQTTLEQCWFPGVHSNIGGGYADKGLSNGCLQWMAGKARATGLAFDETKLQNYPGCATGVLRNSYTPMYYFWPQIWRTIGECDKPGDTSTNPEQVKDNSQFIGESVSIRMADKELAYKPKNVMIYNRKYPTQPGV
jgi:uncharacterized protein (DUF2235 family)